MLLLVTRDQSRGPEVFATVLARELADRGLVVRLRSLAPGPVEGRLGVSSLGPRTLGLAALHTLRREARAHDVVVAFGSRTLPASVLSGAASMRPVVYQNIGDPLYWAGGRRRRLWVRALLGRTAAVAALTPESAGILEQHFGVPRDRLRVIRNARSHHDFRPPTPSERRCARAQLAWPELAGPDSAVVTVVGALSPEKRVDLAIDAVSRMDPRTHLLVVGSGPLEAELRSQARSVLGRGRFAFVGNRRDMPSVYWASDVVLMTSDSEGVPGALVEAALSGVPTVATEVGYVRDIVEDGRTGVLIRGPGPDAVAAAIRQAMARRAELGREARRHAVERFSLEVAVGDWLDLIGSVTGVRGVR